MKLGIRFLLALMLFAATVRGDEIRLKDGSKIIGTIVGYEDDSFKVQTSYGFALVRKDDVAEIIPSAPKQPPPAPAPKPKDSPVAAAAGDAASDNHSASAAAAPAPPVPPPVSAPASPAVSAPDPSPAVAPKPAPAPAPAPRVTPAKPAPHASKTATPSAAPAPAVVASETPAAAPAPHAPPADSKPEPIREEIVGNLYINHSFGFDIYKPPDWSLLPDEMNSLPNAVAAMGTDDGATLLLIGRAPRKGSLDAQAADTDSQLHNIYDNIRLTSSTHTSVGGEDAVERHFRGSAADRDWSVIVVTVAHGSDVFTVLGMTYADSDLIQIQENVIARAISSLRFETQ